MLFDLVFEGGGVRGTAFIGALEALADEGHEFDRLMGTSVGGLTSALLATGHDPHALRDLVFDRQSGRLALAGVLTPYPPFSDSQIGASATRKLLRDIDFPFIPDWMEGSIDEQLAQTVMANQRLRGLFSIVERMGATQDTDFVAWLSALFNTHAGGEDWASMGLAELYRRNGRSLTVIASDISGGRMLVLNHSTAPQLPLKWAVRMTTGVPFLFPPVIWRPEWGMYRKRRLEGNFIVDGGMLSQFPLELFLSDQKEIIEMLGEPKAGNNVLGLLLDETEPVTGVKSVPSPWAQRMENVPGIRFSLMMFKTLLTSSNRSAVNPLESHVLRLPVMGVEPFAFETGLDELVPVLNAAYNATQDFLHGWEQDPRVSLTTFERQYVQIVAEKFVIGGDYYSIGDIVGSSGIAIGEDAKVDIDRAQ